MRNIWTTKTACTYWDNFWRMTDIESEVRNVKNIYELDILREYLPKRGLILEAGCGLGRLLIYLKSVGYNVIGADNIFYPLQQVKKYYPDIPVVCADIANTPFSNSSFNGCIAFGVFSWIKDNLRGSINKAYDVLKPGGILILAVPNDNLFFRIRNRVTSSFFLRKCLGKPPCEWGGYMFKRKEIEKILTDSNFEILKTSVTYPQAGFWLNFPFFRKFSAIRQRVFHEEEFIKKSRDGVSAYSLNLLGLKIYSFFLKRNPLLFSLGVLVVARKQTA